LGEDIVWLHSHSEENMDYSIFSMFFAVKRSFLGRQAQLSLIPTALLTGKSLFKIVDHDNCETIEVLASHCGMTTS